MNYTGIIDIGTNTVLCLKAETNNSGITIISDNRFHYRAGKRMDQDGNISKDYKTGMKKAVHQALDVLKDCSAIKIAATEVLRKPLDGSQFASELSAEIDYPVQIIESDKEAELSFYGATYGLKLSGKTVAVVDIGGGSTELAIGTNGKLKDWSGVKLGAVTLNELAGTERPLNDYIDVANRIFDESDFATLLRKVESPIITVGGTAVSLAAILCRLMEFKPEKINNYILSINNLVRLLEKLESISEDERKKIMAFDSQRADIIVSGGAILLTFMRNFNIDKVSVSIYGLRHGLLLEYLGKGQRIA